MKLVDANKRSDRIKDVLVGCLNRASITEGNIAAHLATLGDDVPNIPAPQSLSIEARDESPFDQVMEEGVTLESGVEASARELHRRISEAGENSPVTGDSISNLINAFVNSHATFTAANDIPARLKILVVDAACRLARDPNVTPDHKVAPLIMEVLENGAEHADVGVLHMMGWSPGMRDSAIEGLSILATRELWRKSEYGDSIRSRLGTAIEDESPVVRMNAAEAFRSLHSDATTAERVNKLRDLLDREDHPNVKLVHLSALGNEVRESYTEVDAVLRDIAASAKLKGGLTQTTDDQRIDVDGSDPAAARLDEYGRLLITLIALLALVHQTPFAKETVDDWAANASQSPELLHAIPFTRSYLTPATRPSLQSHAFAFVRAAAKSALERWSQAHAQPISEMEVPAAERTELHNALRVLDTLASQIYFASGAFNDKSSNGTDADTQSDPPTPAEFARFANLAVPVLLTCAGAKAAPVIHHVVETLIFLAPLDEKRGLVALAEAVTANAGYAYDSLAASVVIPYLTRLLAEERDLVLFDVEGVIAFRTLLSAFASAGNEAALVMAFTFADVFR